MASSKGVYTINSKNHFNFSHYATSAILHEFINNIIKLSDIN